MERFHLSRQPTGGLVATPNVNGTLQVWERPLVGCRYLVSVRGGGTKKVVGGRFDRERSVVMVLRRGYVEEPSQVWKRHRLVARLVPPVLLDATPLAEFVAMVATWYGDPLCFVEVKDGPTLARECQRLGAAVQIREVLDKASSEWTQELGWLTDDDTGPAALNELNNAIRETAAAVKTPPKVDSKALQVDCDHCLAELGTFAPSDGDAPAIAHDDDVRTLATAIYNIESASMLHPVTRQRMAPADGWRAVQTFG